MRRLFWTFPDGLPGAGLLVMRLGTATALLVRCISGRWGEPPGDAWALAIVLPAVSALFLLAGLWTPLAALLVAGIEVWRSVSQPGDPWIHILMGTLGAALALLGPGAWSVDAYLFGWRRIQVRDRGSDPNTP